MRKLFFILLILAYAFYSKAQQDNCTLKPSAFTIHFGAGRVSESNNMVPVRYSRVPSYCPSDGHYAFTSSTNDCFGGDWFNISQDHTSGDVDGNMLLVNSSPRSGMFFNTNVHGLKGNTVYEFSVWMMNVCRITDKCPFPLLPSITIALQNGAGKNVAQLETGEVQRMRDPKWTQYRFLFTTPASATDLTLYMINNAPGGCGNDFVVDDITFRECVKTPPPAVTKKTSTAKPTAKKVIAKTPATNVKRTVAANPPRTAPAKVSKPAATKPPATKTSSNAVLKKPAAKVTTEVKSDTQKIVAPPVQQRTIVFPPPPPALTKRSNSLVRKIEMEPGEVKINLYDNGEIDGDTVSIYHNNKLIASRARLSAEPLTFRLNINNNQPYHEFVMVAENLGSIPPNTSLMVVSAGDLRHEVFISSSKQKNAKVVFAIKQ